MTSYELLQHNWPATCMAVRQTFFQQRTFGTTTVGGQNDAGFLLTCLTRFQSDWASLHSHRNIGRWALDRAAADEVRYQWQRGRQYTRPAAALGKCIQCLTRERPEKIFRIADQQRRQNENATTNTSKSAESDRRGHGTNTSDMSLLPCTVGATASNGRH